jgi:hypothetical protein
MSMMVPISLIVSSEVVKFVQSKFIQWDIDLYYGKFCFFLNDLSCSVFVFSNNVVIIVSFEVVKFVQSKFIQWDIDLYYGKFCFFFYYYYYF